MNNSADELRYRWEHHVIQLWDQVKVLPNSSARIEGKAIAYLPGQGIGHTQWSGPDKGILYICEWTESQWKRTTDLLKASGYPLWRQVDLSPQQLQLKWQCESLGRGKTSFGRCDFMSPIRYAIGRGCWCEYHSFWYPWSHWSLSVSTPFSRSVLPSTAHYGSKRPVLFHRATVE